MNRTGYGWLAGIAGAALAAWYWRGRQGRGRADVPERGEVIFSNSPVASSEGIL